MSRLPKLTAALVFGAALFAASFGPVGASSVNTIDGGVRNNILILNTSKGELAVKSFVTSAMVINKQTLPDGSVLLYGPANSLKNPKQEVCTALKTTPQGYPDPSFGPGGMRQYSLDTKYCGVRLTDYKRVLVINEQNQIYAYQMNGQLDLKFGQRGRLNYPTTIGVGKQKQKVRLDKMEVATDGAVWLVFFGEFIQPTENKATHGLGVLVARMTKDGQLDRRLHPSGFVNTGIRYPDPNMSTYAFEMPKGGSLAFWVQVTNGEPATIFGPDTLNWKVKISKNGTVSVEE